jgi:hypothetical protein
MSLIAGVQETCPSTMDQVVFQRETLGTRLDLQ